MAYAEQHTGEGLAISCGFFNIEESEQKLVGSIGKSYSNNGAFTGQITW
jgi:hypothetical protein